MQTKKTGAYDPATPRYQILRSADAPLREGELTGKDEHIWTRYGVASDAVFLIRPDGYIGFIGHQGTAPQVERYVQTAGSKKVAD
jgi:hypothetical protein